MRAASNDELERRAVATFSGVPRGFSSIPRAAAPHVLRFRIGRGPERAYRAIYDTEPVCATTLEASWSTST
jgi:hypothetical protein